jgi:iron complex transport system substrate-binding protein
MKRILLVALCALLLVGCAAKPSGAQAYGVFTDALGREVRADDPQRVVALYGSLAEAGLLAGGKLAGTPEDAVSERGSTADTVSIVGTVKAPDMEAVFALDPDLVIMSADIEAQIKLVPAFEQAGITCACLREDTFEDYLSILGWFTSLTGDTQAYETYGLSLKADIETLKEKAKAYAPRRVLLIRAFSGGAKAKTDDNLAGVILKDLGCDNIAARHASLLDELSIESIIEEDPEFIFVTVMGADTDAALEAVNNGIAANPAWAGLSAVKNGRFIVLPKELFHYKPNARWAESYEYLFNLLFEGDHA